MDWVYDPWDPCWEHTAAESLRWLTIFQRPHQNWDCNTTRYKSVDCQTIHTEMVILGIFPKNIDIVPVFSRHIPDKIGNFSLFYRKITRGKCPLLWIYWFTSTFKQNLVILVIDQGCRKVFKIDSRLLAHIKVKLEEDWKALSHYKQHNIYEI